MKNDHTCAALFRTANAEVEVSGTNADEVLRVSRDLTANIKGEDLADIPKLVRSPEISRRVFIVHGHDDGTLEGVARFLERLGFEPVILREQANKGRTIITKFREEAAQVGFAIVLMTPDDHGGKAGSETRPRARQNVVFELGFFIGALGPERVAALVKGNVERPSDLDGVVYISLDQSHWKAALGKELQAAGFKIDWNDVMRA
jgi:predicted nucleotide-binding protein